MVRRQPFRVRPKSRVLSPGSTPPDFGFGNEGSYYRLSQLRDQRRFVIVFCPGDLESSCTEGMKAVHRDWPEFKKRDTIVVVISPASEEILLRFAEAEKAPVIMISDERQETIERYGARGSETPVAYLVGKDGIIQTAWTHWPTNREIFDAIDSGSARGPGMSESFEAA